MNLWFEAIASTLFAAAGGLLGVLFSRLRKPYWTLGYYIPLAFVLAYVVALHYPALSFTPPISWMMMGRKKFAFLTDHYVTVLGFTDSEVIVGDPLNGLDKLPRDEFLKKWRFEGIVLKR